MTELQTFSDPRVLRAIELVWHEAALLDEKNYPAWEELFTDDGYYVIPIDPDTTDFGESLNMIYDDKRMRSMRVERMMQGYSPSAVAAARTIRGVSRFVVDDVSDSTVVVRSAQILSAYKREEFYTIGAELEHTIELNDAGDKIKLKVARMLNSEHAVNAAGFLI